MVFSIIFNSSLSYYFLDILTSSKINMSKSHEKIYILTGLSLLCLTSVIAFGAETPVQMATLRWSGDGEFMSWHWEKLGEPFEDGATRFAAESRIVSPTECIICGRGGSRLRSGRLGGSRAGMGTDKRRMRLRVDNRARSGQEGHTPARASPSATRLRLGGYSEVTNRPRQKV